MSIDNDFLIIRFFSPIIISSNSNMTSSQNEIKKEVLNLSYINISIEISLLSIILSTSSSLKALIPPLSFVSAHKKGYKYLDITVKLFIILLKNIILINGKMFIKIANLAHFSRLKKYNKVLDNRTQLLKV